MICLQKIYGFHGQNHQIMEKNWDATPVTEDEWRKIVQYSDRPETAQKLNPPPCSSPSGERKLSCKATFSTWSGNLVYIDIAFLCFVFLRRSHQNSSRLHAVVCRKRRGAHLDPQTVSPYVLPSRMSEWRTHLSYLLSATLNHFLIHSNYTFSIESRRICSPQPSMINWLCSPIFPCTFVCLFVLLW